MALGRSGRVDLARLPGMRALRRSCRGANASRMPFHVFDHPGCDERATCICRRSDRPS
jgi:hypothetical protein